MVKYMMAWRIKIIPDVSLSNQYVPYYIGLKDFFGLQYADMDKHIHPCCRLEKSVPQT